MPANTMHSIMGRLLKETKENHKQMAPPFCSALVAGTLPVKSYVGQLKTMAMVHSVLEREMETSTHTAVLKVNNRDHLLRELSTKFEEKVQSAGGISREARGNSLWPLLLMNCRDRGSGGK